MKEWAEFFALEEREEGPPVPVRPRVRNWGAHPRYNRNKAILEREVDGLAHFNCGVNAWWRPLLADCNREYVKDEGNWQSGNGPYKNGGPAAVGRKVRGV